jgi:glucan biosynthesis protein C
MSDHNSNDEGRRFNGFDALRAAMLLLGVVLHASASYFPDEPGMRNPELWYFYDTAESWLSVVLFASIHIYRLPVFFVMAGFFTALQIRRRSVRQMLIIRVQRIAIPLPIAALLFIPSMYVMARFAYFMSDSTALPRQMPFTFKVWLGQEMHYLWFLWHLLILCSLTAIVATVLRRYERNHIRHEITTLAQWITTSPLGITVLLAVTYGLNCFMRPFPGFLETDTTYLPAAHVLAYHGLYFCYGIAVFHNQGVLERLSRQAIPLLMFGSTFLAIFLVMLAWHVPSNQTLLMRVLLSVVSAGATWLMVWACLGLAIRYGEKPTVTVRYLADASYWVYLLHMPVLFLTQALLAPLPISGTLKLTISSATTMAICIYSYHLLVRFTWIGKLLNGRRHQPTPKQSALARPSLVCEIQQDD